ncbi:hypothetical protein CTI12_AA556660 [Artemisia annua]|uniref:Uncharacterized protein n=1 Tax=Artemisia annua TaxID=35608 RepID=A0A2U1KWF1_ARTAN|nr:hypothetical protein CTI12_AA556660 [Artemisia annua]
MLDPQYTTSTPSTTRCTGAPSSGSKDIQNYPDSIRGELKEELKEEMKVDLKEEMKNELKEEMREDLKEETREELKEEMRAIIQDMLIMVSRVMLPANQKQNKVMQVAVHLEHQPLHFVEF